MDEAPFRQPPRGRSAAATSPEGGGKGVVRMEEAPFRQPPRGGSAAATSPEGGGKGVVRPYLVSSSRVWVKP